jgi:hypothetical protein
MMYFTLKCLNLTDVKAMHWMIAFLQGRWVGRRGRTGLH